jgi:hypothetical protein
MPAFTFEKISPPIPHGPESAESTEKKSRGVILQIFSRLVETRVERAQRVEQSIASREPQPKQG